MQSDHSANGTNPPSSLPPVEPPSARFILQLFLVPGILVALVVAFIWLFFGWVGGGPRSPEEFLAGLSSSNELKRWKTAQDLAQVLPRDPVLRANVPFALALAELLDREMKRPPEPSAPGGETQEAPDLMEFLPAAVGNMALPAGLPLLQKLVADNLDRLDRPEDLLRLRTSVLAIGQLGSRLREFDQLPKAERQALAEELSAVAKSEGPESEWASRAFEYLQSREGAGAKKPDPYGVVRTLAAAARSGDEMTRKYAILALANWGDTPGADQLLKEMTVSSGGLTRLEDADQARAYREIRYNAALALAHGGSPLTPVDLVQETLDPALLEKHYAANPGLVSQWNLKALHDLAAWKHKDPEGFARQTVLLAAVEKLRSSGPAAVQVEAERLLGGAPAAAAASGRFSRQMLLIVSLFAGILLLLAIGVLARWRKGSPPEVLAKHGP